MQTSLLKFFFRSINERSQQISMKTFYAEAKKKNMRKIKLCVSFLQVIYPIFSIVFIVLFWMVGLVNYFKES